MAKAQDVESYHDSIYNNLTNHTPKNFVIDEVSKTQSDFLGLKLNSISGLKFAYKYQDELKLQEQEIKWLNSQINEMALAFYLEGNPILIRKTGGYSGCEEINVNEAIINEKRVTILNFCFTCKGAGQLEEFINIFNYRTKKLLKIETEF